MSMRFSGFLLAAVLLLSAQANAQRTCGTVQYNQKQEQLYPEIAKERARLEALIYEATQGKPIQKQAAEIITIPVVFHVVYRTDEENISDDQILSQLTILNQDFRKQNTPLLPLPPAFADDAADTEIEFCLAHTDPSGYYTSGITRTRTSVTSFIDDDKVKDSNTGGRSAWDATKYLNIWVCRMGNDMLGYSSVPGGNPATDGVVITHTALGNTGTVVPPYNKGRTLTHEIGHWLNLRHIWGDAHCGDDLIPDTPKQESENYGCKVYPYRPNSCNTINPHGDMFMNYMDYTDDNCMSLFTFGQKNRMRASYGFTRKALSTSTACNDGSGDPEPADVPLVRYYFNPASRNLEFFFARDKTAGPYTIFVYDQIGRKVKSLTSASLTDHKLHLNLAGLHKGVYTALVQADGLYERRQFLIMQ